MQESPPLACLQDPSLMDNAIQMDGHMQPSPPMSHSGEGEDGEESEEGDSVNPREGSSDSKGKAFARSRDAGVFEMTAVLPRGPGGGGSLAASMTSSPLAKLRLNSAGACQC